MHAAEFGSAILVRISLIFLLLNAFFLRDISAYAISAIFAITMDCAGILGAYIANNLLTARLSWLCGFSLHVIGCIIAASTIGSNIVLFYLALAMISVGIGIMKCNSLVITNDYIKVEINDKYQCDYNSIMYFTMIIASFCAVFSSGIILKIFSAWAIFASSIFVISIAAIVFLITEIHNIKDDIKLCFFGQNKKFNFIKFSQLTLLLFGSVSILCIAFYFNLSIFVKHLPLMVFLIFYIYLLIRSYNNPEDRKYILYAIMFSIILTFYISLEKQIENILALFVTRNVDRHIFGFEIPTLNINSFFQFSVVTIGITFFIKKIQSKIQDNVMIMVILFFSIASFAMLYFGTLMNVESMVKLRYYYSALVIMAIGDVFVYSKLFSICRIMPNNMRNILSSFMMINVSFGFYLCRVYADLTAINTKIIDKTYSLSVYQGHFMRMIVIGSVFSLIIFLFYNFKGRKIIKDINLLNES